MRLALAAAALMIGVGPAIAEAVPSGLTVKVGTVRKTDIGVDVNFSISNADGSSVGTVFTACTAIGSDGQPKATTDQVTHNVKAGETAYGQAQFEEGEATVKDRFTCRIDQVDH